MAVRLEGDRPSPTPNRAAVYRLQQILNTVGAGLLEEDGEFGTATEKAVKVVQHKLNLTQDGVVGKNTWSALLKTNFFGSLPG